MKPMKEAIKLTSVSGETIYLKDSWNVTAIAQRKDGDLIYTDVFTHAAVFRVKQPVEEVATLFGWEPKQIEPATESP